MAPACPAVNLPAPSRPAPRRLQNNLHDSRELLQTCIDLDDSDAHSWLALARIEASTGSLRGARAIVGAALAKCPRNVHLMHAGALFEARMGKIAAARALFAEALQVSPGNAYAAQRAQRRRAQPPRRALAQPAAPAALALPRASLRYVVHAWGLAEQQAGNLEGARALYANHCSGGAASGPQGAVSVDSAAICTAWAALEGMQGNAQRARELHTQAVALCGAEAELALGGTGNRRGGVGSAGGLRVVEGLLTWAEFEHTQANDQMVPSTLPACAALS